LDIWTNLISDEKKDYKTPRVPKQKRENDEVKSTSNKLARFAAPTLVPKQKRENDEVKSTSNKLARFAAPNLS